LLGRGGGGRVLFTAPHRVVKVVEPVTWGSLRETFWLHSFPQHRRWLLQAVAPSAPIWRDKRIAQIVHALPQAACSWTHAEPTSWAQLKSWLQDLLTALYLLHQRGLVHGDLKPANVLLMPDGTCRLGDWDLTRSLHWPLARTARPQGTPAWHCQDPVRTPAVDLWGLGLILLDLLSPQRPVVDQIMHLCCQYDWERSVRLAWDACRQAQKVDLPAAAWDELGALVIRLLSPQPEQRPTSEALLTRYTVLKLVGPLPPPLPPVHTWPRVGVPPSLCLSADAWAHWCQAAWELLTARSGELYSSDASVSRVTHLLTFWGMLQPYA